MTFAGESTHRCKCFGENDGPYGAWCACPPELCEADVLLARVTALKERAEAAEAERDHWRELTEAREAENDRLARQVADLEALSDKIGKFAMSHSGRDGHGVLLRALYRIGEECETALAARSRDPQEPQT